MEGIEKLQKGNESTLLLSANSHGSVNKKPFSEKRLKGISLPVNTVVIVAILILVVAVGASFLAQSAGKVYTQAEAQSIFAQGCQRYHDCDSFQAAYDSSAVAEINPSAVDELDEKFITACVSLGYITQQERLTSAQKCFAVCGCDTTPSEERISDNMLGILGTAEAGLSSL